MYTASKKNRLYRIAEAAFAGLIATPTGANLTLPAGSRFLFKYTGTGTPPGSVATLADGTVIGCAGTETYVDWIPQGTTVTVASGIAMYLDCGLRYKLIATGA